MIGRYQFVVGPMPISAGPMVLRCFLSFVAAKVREDSECQRRNESCYCDDYMD